MNLDSLKGALLFILLLLVQVLVLNNIHLLDCATPLLYIYIALLFKRDYPRWGIMLLCFLMGLGTDMFANTPGVGAASMTLIGTLQPYLLSLFLNRDAPDDLKPGMKSLGVSTFSYYTFTVTLLYCIIFFTIETFNFFNWTQWSKNVIGSSLLTTALILAVENIRKR